MSLPSSHCFPQVKSPGPATHATGSVKLPPESPPRLLRKRHVCTCMHMYVELVSSMQMNASCMRMSAVRLLVLGSCALGLALSLRMQTSTDEAEQENPEHCQLWCGVCGYATPKNQMLCHIQRWHDLAALFKIRNYDGSTTMNLMRTQFPGLVRDKW